MTKYKKCKHNPLMPFTGNIPMITKRFYLTDELRCSDCKAEFGRADYEEFYPELTRYSICPHSTSKKKCEGILEPTYIMKWVCPGCEKEANK